MSWPNWGDVPTWLQAVFTVLAAGFAGAAAVFAYRQLRHQSDVVKLQAEALKLQADALAEQSERGARRDELIASQLREIAQRSRVMEREQAEQMVVEPVTVNSPPEGIELNAGDRLHAIRVVNGSLRPFFVVRAGIQPQGDPWSQPQLATAYHELKSDDMRARLVHTAAPGLVVGKTEQGSRLKRIRAGETYRFLFPFSAGQHPHAIFAVRFEDDLGLQWEMDGDQHLVKLDDNQSW